MRPPLGVKRPAFEAADVHRLREPVGDERADKQNGAENDDAEKHVLQL